MRNKKNYNLFSLGKNQTSVCGTAFPNSKLNYTNEILLWYTLLLVIKKFNLKKHKTIICCKFTVLPNGVLVLNLITHKTHNVFPYQKGFYFKNSRNKYKTKRNKYIIKLLGLTLKRRRRVKIKNYLTKFFFIKYLLLKKKKVRLNRSRRDFVKKKLKRKINKLTQLYIHLTKIKRNCVQLNTRSIKQFTIRLRFKKWTNRLQYFVLKKTTNRRNKFYKKHAFQKTTKRRLKKKIKNKKIGFSIKKKRVLNKLLLNLNSTNLNKCNMLIKKNLSFKKHKISIIQFKNNFRKTCKRQKRKKRAEFWYKQILAKLKSKRYKRKIKCKYKKKWNKKIWRFLFKKLKFRYLNYSPLPKKKLVFLKKKQKQRQNSALAFVIANKKLLSVFFKKPKEVTQTSILEFLNSDVNKNFILQRYWNKNLITNKSKLAKIFQKLNYVSTFILKIRKGKLLTNNLTYFCTENLIYTNTKNYKKKYNYTIFKIRKSIKPWFLWGRNTKWKTKKNIIFLNKQTKFPFLKKKGKKKRVYVFKKWKLKKRFLKKKKIKRSQNKKKKKFSALKKLKKKIIAKTTYLFLKKKINYFLQKYLLIKFNLTCVIKFVYGLLYNTKIKRYIKIFLFSSQNKRYKKLNKVAWLIYKLLPFRKYNNITILLFSLKELIGTKQRQHKIERRLVESKKKKKAANPSAVLKELNFIHQKIQVKKRRQAFLFFAFKNLMLALKPDYLTFFMIQLKGKVNSKTRRSVFKLKNNFKNIALYNTNTKIQFEYKFLPIRAKIGAFGLHFFGGLKKS